MPGQESTKKAVSTAQSALDKAQKFQNSIEGPPKNPPPAAPKPTPPVKPPAGPSIRAQNNAVANEEAAKYGMKGVPIWHKGGVVKEDGPGILKKGETIRTPEQEKKMQEKVKKSKAEEVMTKDEKTKTAKKKTGKKNHAHKIEVEKKTGGYLVKTHRKPAENADKMENQGPEESVHPDLNSVTDHINQNMEPDEAQEPEDAEAPPPAAAPPSASQG